MLILGGILIIAFGLLNIFKPEFAWELKEGWKVDGDSEPSDSYLLLTKITGGLLTIAGVVVIIGGILS